MILGTAFPTKLHVYPAKTQISISYMADDPLDLWLSKGRPAKTMITIRRLIWAFAGPTCSFVGNATPRLKYYL